MTRKEFIEYFKKTYSPDGLGLTPAKNKTWICPCCSSGAGAHGTGMTYDNTSLLFTCWNCNDNYIGKLGSNGAIYRDAFDIIGELNNLTDFNDQLREACRIDGQNYDDLEPDTMPTAAEVFGVAAPAPKQEKKPDEEADLYIQYAKEDIARAQKTPEGALLYLEGRSISRATAQKFNIGYLEEWAHPKNRVTYGNNAYKSKRVIIPLGDSAYLARATEEGITNPKARTKGAALFNATALRDVCFLVEGEIDALSIIELGFNACAIGSAAGASSIAEEVKKYKTENTLVILALDNDAKNGGDAGEKATQKAAEALKSSYIDYYRPDVSSLFLGEKDANDALRKDRVAFGSMLKEIQEEALKHVAELKEEALKEYKSEHNAAALFEGYAKAWKEAPLNITSTGFNELDAVLGGGLYEGLYVIGANPSQGKTTLALQIADNVARGGRDVIIFSLEQSAEELTAKSISRLTAENAIQYEGEGVLSDLTISSLTQREIQYGQKGAGINSIKQTALKGASEVYLKEIAPRLYFYEGVGYYDIFKIIQETKEAFNKLGSNPLIVIDYLQAMKAPRDPEEPRRQLTDKQSIDTAITELKRLSRDLKTTIFLISSFNRSGYSGEGSMTSFKESGGIEYGADVLITLTFAHIKSPYFDEDIEKAKTPREIELKIVKQRAGIAGRKLALAFYPDYNFFKVYSESELKSWRSLRAFRDSERTQEDNKRKAEEKKAAKGK